MYVAGQAQLLSCMYVAGQAQLLSCMYVAGQAQLLSCMYVQSVMVGSRGARSINFRAFSPVVGGLVDLIRTSSAGRKAASWVEKLIRSDRSDHIRSEQTDRQAGRQTYDDTNGKTEIRRCNNGEQTDF